MTSVVKHAAVTLLTLALALCLATPTTAIPTPSYTIQTGMAGVSYFWQVIQEMESSGTYPTLQAQLDTAFQTDLQTAAGSDVTITYNDFMVNASSMYMEYYATVVASSPTEAEVKARIATSTFPSVKAVLDTLSSSSTFTTNADLVPSSLYVTYPLFLDPNWDDSSSAYKIVSSVEYDVVVMFSGAPASWTTVLASDRSTVSSNIVAAVQALLDSSKEQNAVTVSDMYVLAADSDKKSMGSGAGGMIARLSVVCYGTSAMTGRYLSTSEYASVLLTLDTTTLTATFQAASGSSATVVVEETTSVAALDVNTKCDSACKGMIAMTAVVVALSALCAVIAIIAIVCPCCCIPSARFGVPLVQKNQYGVHTEVAEAIDVYGEEGHAPTTAAPRRNQSNEPTYE